MAAHIAFDHILYCPVQDHFAPVEDDVVIGKITGKFVNKLLKFASQYDLYSARRTVLRGFGFDRKFGVLSYSHKLCAFLYLRADSGRRR